MKKLFTALIMVVLLLSLCSCDFAEASIFYDHVANAVDGFNVGYNKTFGYAFLGKYSWDGTEEGMHIVLPETYNGAKVTELGGFCGRGVPTPFGVNVTNEAWEKLCPDMIDYSWSFEGNNISQKDIKDDNIAYWRFQLHIGKNVKSITKMSAFGGVYRTEYEENGETLYRIFILTCYVTCDEQNPVFYDKDGKLYWRETNMAVEEFCYEDFDLSAVLEQ